MWRYTLAIAYLILLAGYLINILLMYIPGRYSWPVLILLAIAFFPVYIILKSGGNKREIYKSIIALLKAAGIALLLMLLVLIVLYIWFFKDFGPMPDFG